MKIALLLLSIISANIYSMKRGPSEDKPTDEGKDMQHDSTISKDNKQQEDPIKKRRINKNACGTNREVQDGALYNYSLSEDLVKAVKTGNESDVRKLLQARADPHAKNSKAIPCLCSAAQKGYKELVELLIAHGADVNAQTSNGGIALMYAALKGHKELVELLIAHGANINAQTSNGRTALNSAAAKGNKEIVELLLNAGANVNAQMSTGITALMWAAAHGHKEVIELLIARKADVNTQTSNGSTALSLAVMKGNKEIVKVLLENRANLDLTKNIQGVAGITALMDAAKKGHKEIVELLIAHRADVNAQDKYGMTALMYAAQEVHKEIVELLIAHGAHVNAQNNIGYTTLMDAALKGHKEIVELLIAHGAHVNAQGSRGMTALMCAAQKGYKEIVETLIAHGAHVNARNSSGETALMRVSKPEIVALLLNHSAEFTRNDNNKQSIIPTKQLEPYFRNFILQRAALSNVFLRENRDMLLSSCSTMPELQLYRNEPLSYTQWHKVHCLEKSKYIRLCESNRSQVNNYLLMQEPDHNQRSHQTMLPWWQRWVQESDHNQCSHQTVLMWASMLGHKEALEELLKAYLPLWYLNAQDEDGRTALIYAIIYGHTGIVQLLVQAYEKNVEHAYLAQESETDPTKKSFLMKELEKAKRALNISDNKGKSALVYALEKENKEIAHRLLQAGARPSLTLIKKLAENNYALATRLLVSFSYTAEGKRYPLLL